MAATIADSTPRLTPSIIPRFSVQIRFTHQQSKYPCCILGAHNIEQKVGQSQKCSMNWSHLYNNINGLSNLIPHQA